MTIAVVLLSVILLVFLGINLYPKFAGSFQTNETLSTNPVEELLRDTVPYFKYLETELGVLETKRVRKADGRKIWILGKGRTIVDYLLQTKRHVEKYGGSVLFMEELSRGSASEAATVDFVDVKGDTVLLELWVSKDNYLKGNSKLAVVFQGTDLSAEGVARLDKLPYAHAVLVPPWKIANKQVVAQDLGELNGNPLRTLVAWLYMESTKINAASARAIRIHHTEDDIKATVKQAFEVVPSALGIATRYGEQAVEHKNLLKAVLKNLQEREAFFLDLTGTTPSATKGVCAELGIDCLVLDAYNPDTKTVEDYVTMKIHEATKRGNAVLVLPMSKATWEALAGLEERVESRGIEITTLQSLIGLR